MFDAIAVMKRRSAWLEAGRYLRVRPSVFDKLELGEMPWGISRMTPPGEPIKRIWDQAQTEAIIGAAAIRQGATQPPSDRSLAE